MENHLCTELTPGQVLATNLTVALKVAGPQDEYGKPRRMKSTQMQRNTGIARSTLRALKRCDANHEPNPDLRTLCRIADELRVPVAFLLMGPSQWRSLMAALNDMGSMLEAASKVESGMGLQSPQAAEQILRLLKVHPFMPPPDMEKSRDEQMTSLEQRNESRRRTTLVTAALAQTAARDVNSRKFLTALAASLANQTAINPNPL